MPTRARTPRSAACSSGSWRRLLVAGILVCWQRRREPLVRFLLRRSSSPRSRPRSPTTARRTRCAPRVMLPFLVVLAILGADRIRRALRDHPAVLGAVAGVLGLGLVAQGALFTVDLFTAYPNRAAADFDTGELEAITHRPRRRGRASSLPLRHPRPALHRGILRARCRRPPRSRSPTTRPPARQCSALAGLRRRRRVRPGGGRHARAHAVRSPASGRLASSSRL